MAPEEMAPEELPGTAQVSGGEPSTGARDPRVDAALAELAALDQLPVSEHAGRYGEIQRRLQELLTDRDGGASDAPS